MRACGLLPYPYQARYPADSVPFIVSTLAQNSVLDDVIADGFCGPVQLGSMTMGAPSKVGTGGELLEPVYAWRWGEPARLWDSPDDGSFPPYYVKGYLSADRWIPDPASVGFRRKGAVLLADGVLRSLEVPSWLGPMGDRLRERYQVPVKVAPGPTTRPLPAPAEPLVMPKAVSSEMLAALRCIDATGIAPSCFEAHMPRPARFQRTAMERGGVGVVVLGVDHYPAFRALLRRAARLFDLPVNTWLIPPTVHRQTGAGFREWQRMRAPKSRPPTWSCTVGAIVALNDPDECRGGQIETEAGRIDLVAGDAIAITASTRYRIRPVSRGSRCLAIVAGAWDGWASGLEQ